jgi:hypothetical protein
MRRTGHRAICLIVFISLLYLTITQGQMKNKLDARSIRAGQTTNLAGNQACRSCHGEKVNTYLTTAHHYTSQLPTQSSIAGSFAPGLNVLKTSNQYLYFFMQAKPEGFFESAVEQVSPVKTERAKRICFGRERVSLNYP